MLKGVNDKMALGMDYDKIDIIFYGMERGLKDEEIMEYGPTKAEISRMREMHDLSNWKRSGEGVSRPVCAGL